MNAFGPRLRAARLAASLKQSELGDLIGVSGAAVSRWESGRDYPSFELLPKLRAALRRSLDELLVDEIAKVKGAARAMGIADERGEYRAPDVARAQSSRELGLLMWFRLLSDSQQRGLLEMIKPQR